MLLLSKAFSQLLLPPGGLILIGLLGLIFWKKLWGRSLVGLALILFWLLSTEPVRDVLTSSLEYQYPPIEIENINSSNAAIVLLGGGIRENSLDYYGSDELSHSAMMRTIYAAKLAEHTSVDIYPTGGISIAKKTEAESSIMYRWLLWFGVNENRIHEENRAKTTWENAVFTQKMLSEQGINNIILVTSAWHMPRSIWCFEQQGLKVVPAPTDYLTRQTPYELRSYLPKGDVFDDSAHALHEYLGLIWYRLKYTDQSTK